ncbi:MAG: hydrogenase expression/formation protein [Gammaproteobacteria bacterium]|nr:hydrogenase expression/formation protein [Gammaproteobacteria bacterium]
MNSLKGIPIIKLDATPVMSHGNALPLLHEIEVLLDQLIATGKSGAIDLRSLPMLADDYEKLKEILGEGEVKATVDAMGPSQVRETAIHGVWWVTHFNSDATVLAEFIEITYIPEILQTHPADARMGLENLRSRLMSTSQVDKGETDV